MVVGLAWGLCAVLCFANLKNVEPAKKPQAIVLCTFFGVFGICGILGGILRSPFLWATGILLPVAILCLFAFVMAIWNHSYPIWINEKVPDAFITRKGLDGKMFVVLFAGLLVLFFYFLVILALIFVKMAPELGIQF